MYYILKSDIALRSWKNIPYTYLVYHQQEPNRLSEEEFLLLKEYDGNTELNETNTLRMLKKLELIEPCGKGE